MFAIATGTVNILIIPVGAILALIFPVRVIFKLFIPKRVSIIGSFALIFGALLLAFASNIPFDAYTPGYLFLSLGGASIYISSLHLSNAFPTHSTLIFSAITGAFNSSSAVFLIFRLINEQTDGRFSTRVFFLVYLIIPITILVAQLTIMPISPYKTPAELLIQTDAYIPTEQAQNATEAEYQQTRRETTMRNIQLLLNDYTDDFYKTRNAIFGLGPLDPGYIPQIQPARSLSKASFSAILQDYTLPNQIFSPWLLLMTALTFSQAIKVNYFVVSIRQQYEYLLSPEQGMKINQIFDVILPVGGILSIPFITGTLNNTNLPFLLTLLVSLSTIQGILNSIPALWTGYTCIILYVFYRPFLFAVISEYMMRTFGLRTYAVVYGVLVSLAGSGNIIIPGLDALTFRAFKSPVPVDVTLTGISFVVGMPLVWFVWSRTRHVRPLGDEGDLLESNEVPCIEDAAGRDEDLERGPLLSDRSAENRNYGSTCVQDGL